VVGAYNVKVTTTGGTSVTSGTTVFTVTTAAPTVASVSPSSGDNSTATSITITGTGYFGGTLSSTVTQVKLDDVANTALTSVTAVNDTTIRGSVPVGVTVGSYNVKVTAAGGTNNTSATRFTVTSSVPAPVVTLVSPSIIPKGTATSITITGSYFLGVINVKLDDGAATALTGVTAVSSTVIQATVPTTVTVGSYNVKVTTPGGTNATSAVQLTVSLAPIVTSFGPNKGYMDSATAVTITGSNFTGTTSVSIGDGTRLASLTYTVVSSTLITGRVPVNTPSGAYNSVTVTSAAGSGTGTIAFTNFIRVSDTGDRVMYDVNNRISITITAGSLTGDAYLVIVPPTSPALGGANAGCQSGHFMRNLNDPWGDIAYDIHLVGATLNPGQTLKITLSFSSSITDTNVKNRIRIVRLNELLSIWELAEGTQVLNKVLNTVTTYITHLSTFRLVDFSAISSDLTAVGVFPNPVNFSTAAGNKLKIFGVTATSDLSIYTLSGDLVIKLGAGETKNSSSNNAAVNGTIYWDGKNDVGENTAAGLYYYLIKDKTGKMSKGKILVNR